MSDTGADHMGNRPGRAAGMRLAQWRGLAIAMLAVVLVVASAGWMAVRGVEDVTVSREASAWLEQQVEAVYRVRLARGALYPRGAEFGPGEHAAIPLRLVSALSVALAHSATGQGMAVSALDYQVDAVVRAGDLWQREYAITARTAGRRADGQGGATVTVSVPIRQFMSDIVAIEREIGMSSPTGRYDVDIRMHTWPAVAGAPEEPRQFTAAFRFGLVNGGLLLEPPDELKQIAREERLTEVRKTSVHSFLGLDYPVAGFRRASCAVAACAAGLLTAMMGWTVWDGRRRSLSDPSRGYRDRLVRVTEVGAANAALSVRIGALQELCRVADDAQAPLMELAPGARTVPPEFDREATPELRGRKYFVLAGNVLFYVV